jgi:hypothetical protein
VAAVAALAGVTVAAPSAVAAGQVTLTLKSNCADAEYNWSDYQQTVAQGTAMPVPGYKTFCGAGYTFTGWATTAAGPATYKWGNTFTPTSDMTLFAVWTPHQHTMAFAANGGSGVTPDKTVAFGSTVALPTPSFSRQGYAFDHWELIATRPTYSITGCVGEPRLHVETVIDDPDYVGYSVTLTVNGVSQTYDTYYWGPDSFGITVGGMSSPNPVCSVQLEPYTSFKAGADFKVRADRDLTFKAVWAAPDGSFAPDLPEVTTPGPVAPAYCGVADGPVDGPHGRFLDILATTPHADDVNWLADEGFSIGWSVSCYRTDRTGGHLVAEGDGYTLAEGNEPAGFGLVTDATYDANQGTAGYVFRPTAEVVRGDAAVWLAKLALRDQDIDLSSPAAVRTVLDGPYSITNSAWAQGADGQWGTDDDATVLTIPVGHVLYREFNDMPVDFAATDNRHTAAVTWLTNTIVDAKFDAAGNLTGGQRLSDGFPVGSAAEYRPGSVIARQDMAAFLYRIA